MSSEIHDEAEPNCPICRAFYHGEVDRDAWKYIALVAPGWKPPRKIARDSRKRFDLDVDADDVEHHLEMNHHQRRSFQ